MVWFSTLLLFKPVIQKVDPWLREHGFNKLSVADRLGVHKILFGVGANDTNTGSLIEQPAGPSPRDVTVRSTIDSCSLIYGQIETAGSIVFVGVGGTDNKYLFFVVQVAHHQCDAITEFRIDNTHIRASQWASGTTNLVSHSQFIGDDGLSKLKITAYAGTNAQAVDSELQSIFPQWDSTHRGKGVAYFVVRCEIDKKAWPAGAPSNFFALVKGRRLYDPRKDSTNGGSGTHRYTDATTWEWSSNPALAFRDYLTGGSICYDVATPNNKLTLGESNSRVDDAFIIAAANHCDESCTVPIPVLAGQTNWTNGSPTVTGYGTEFNVVFASGSFYVLGPDNNFYLIMSVTSDTVMTLTTNYTGTTTSNATTQYFTSASTTTTQNRFTCDLQLSTTSAHGDNIDAILSCMLGKRAYSGGKFRCYAGVYDTPSVTLNDEDILGAMEISTHPAGEELYNLVQGTFFDENRNWQESPFPAQTQSSYQTDDGDLFTKNIRLPGTRTSFRCQRIANVLLNLSRNKTIVKFSRLSQKAIDIEVNDTFYVNIAEYGWSNQVLRCVEWEHFPGDFVAITAQSEGSSAYTDLASTDYQLPRNANAGAQKVLLPTAPTGLTLSPVPGGISAFVSGTFFAGTVIEIWEYTSSSPFSSATKIAEGVENVFVISKGDQITRYYWARARLNGQVSSTYPASTGSSARAALSSWISFGYGVVSNTTMQKVGGSLAWDSGARSINGHATCHVTWKGNANNVDVGVGLTTDPYASDSYATVDYWVDLTQSGVWAIYENGVSIGPSGSYTTSTVFAITYDGSTVRYYVDNVHVYSSTHSAPSLTLYAVFNVWNPGAGINSVRFGPTTNLDVLDTPQIGVGAISTTPVSSSPSDGSISYSATTQPAIESSGINGHITLTPAISTGSSQVDATWFGQVQIDTSTSGTAVGFAEVTATIQVNGSTVFSKNYSIEGTASLGDYITIAGSTNVTVPAGQSVDLYLNSGRSFSTSGSSPAQTHYWRSCHLSLQGAQR
jgi:hypothetical protein